MSGERTTLDELLASARRDLHRLSAPAAWQALHDGACLIDIRSDTQIARDGHIPGAWVVARNVLEWRLDPDSPARAAGAPGLDDAIVLICHEGYASSLAAATLRRLGFDRATDVVGGSVAWREQGLPMSPR